jgi:GNAT superfamily N-acetyltransferase
VNVRPARREDAAAVAELFASLEESVLGRPSRIDEQEVLWWWQGIALETNTWLFEESGTLLAGGGGARRPGDRGVFAGGVRPSARGRGLGAQLVELAEARLADEGAARIQSWALAGDTAATDLFAQRGYREARRFWQMAIDLDEEQPEPSVPVAPFREEEARAVHAALEEAFEDHWENHPRPFEQWWDRQTGWVGYDPSLWFSIREGDEIAAAVINDINAAGGHVGVLGVRRAWRGRGYGRALLLHSFREFRRRGARRATLGVDAASPTGATHLYESVGMHVDQEEIVWEKALQ